MKAFRLRTAGWAFVAIILAASVVLVLMQREALPRIKMADGSEFQILKVEVGVQSIHPLETKLKRLLRDCCPDSWEGALLGAVPRLSFHRTRHDALLVWVSWRTAKGQSITDRKRWDSLLIKPMVGAKAYAPPVISHPGTGIVCLEFRQFPRDLKELSFSVRSETQDVSIQIANPRPVVPEVWKGRSIPQTNHFPETDIILLRTGKGQYSNPDLIVPRFRVESHIPSSGSWVEWRIVGMDDLGNWKEAGFPFRTIRPEFEWRSEGAWKLLAEGVEYFSAGFLPSLTNGAVVEIPVMPRARQFGVESILVVGPGAFHIEDGVAVFQPQISLGGIPGRSSLTLSPAPSPKVWRVDLITVEPGVLCVTAGQSDYKARLRDRPGNYTGGNSNSQRLNAKGKGLWFHFFSKKPPKEDEQLEVEIYGSLPQATFYVE